MRFIQIKILIHPQIEEACTNRLQELGAKAVFTSYTCRNSELFLYGIFSLEADMSLVKKKFQLYLWLPTQAGTNSYYELYINFSIIKLFRSGH